MARSTGIKIAAALVIAIVLLVGGGLIYLYSGAYNVAATDPHSGLMSWLLTTTMVQSVQAHAEGIEVPTVPDSVVLQTGLPHFEEMCVTCHGAPGMEASEIGKGLNPDPPDLSEVADRYSPEELYWIIRHGIKMTGMPAFGPTHSEQELWAIAAFVQQLPGMTPAEYQALRASAGAAHGHAHGAGRASTAPEEHQHANGHAP